MRVLVADDDATTRTLLDVSLTDWGYEPILASDGGEAWAALQGSEPPRLALLDWMMPVLDGIEICRRLRMCQNAPFVYVVLLTSKHKKDDVVLGLEAGADDFISKPFEADELRSRLAAGARILEYDAALAAQNELLTQYATQMESLAEARAKQLVHADRMATLGVMSAGIAHEINNPATFISGNAALLDKFWSEIKEAIEHRLAHDAANGSKLRFILDEYPKAVDGIRSGVTRISRIVNGMKVYSRTGDEECAPCAIEDCIRQALELCHNRLKKHVTVDERFHGSLPSINGRAQELEQVFVNLFMNAADAMAGEAGTLTIRTAHEKDEIWVTIDDTGTGIPAESAEKIWIPFFTTKKAGEGTGLGLPICAEIVRSHGGTLTAVNRPEGGARFTLKLPCAG